MEKRARGKERSKSDRWGRGCSMQVDDSQREGKMRDCAGEAN